MPHENVSVGAVRVPLKDRVLAVMSLTAQNGLNRIPILELFSAFAEVSNKFPARFPELVFSQNAESAYSKQLDSAIQDRIGYGVDLPNPSLQYFEISQDSASRHLTWLKEKYGSDYLSGLKPVVDLIMQRLQTS